jgi:hypothetical protein
MVNTIAEIRNRSNADRNILLQYLLQQFNNSEVYANKTRRLRLNFNGAVPDLPAWFQGDAAAWAVQWARFQKAHPFGLEVVMSDPDSTSRVDLKNFLDVSLESTAHAVNVLLKTNRISAANRAVIIERYSRLVQSAQRRARQLMARHDLSYKQKVKRAKYIATGFHDISYNYLARAFNHEEKLVQRINSGASIYVGSIHTTDKQLKAAKRLLVRAEQRFPCPRAQEDVLVLNFKKAALQCETTTAVAPVGSEFTWEYFRRHYSRTAKQVAEVNALIAADPYMPHDRVETTNAAGQQIAATVVSTDTAHDPDGITLANFAATEQGSGQVAAAAGMGAPEVTSHCFHAVSRTGTPSPLYETTKLKFAEQVLGAYQRIQQLLEDDARQALATGQTDGYLQHIHVHLITAAGLGSRAQNQGQQFDASRIASYAWLPGDFTKVSVNGHQFSVGFNYCCHGINYFRKTQNRAQYGVNAMVNVELFRKFSAVTSFTSDLDFHAYDAELSNLQKLARNYVDALRVSDLSAAEVTARYESVVAKEKQVHGLAVDLQNKIRNVVVTNEKLVDQAIKLAPEVPTETNGVTWEEFNIYYARQCMLLLQQLTPQVNATTLGNFESDRSTADYDHLSDKYLALTQALTLELSNFIDMFSSYGCKSANDRAAMVSLMLKAVTERIQHRASIVLEDIEDLYDAIKKVYVHSATEVHSQKTLRGGVHKYKGHKSVKADSKAERKLRKKLYKEVTHKRAKKKAKAVKRVGEFNETTNDAFKAVFLEHLENDYIKPKEAALRQWYSFSLRPRVATAKAMKAQLELCDSISEGVRLIWLQYKNMGDSDLKTLYRKSLLAFVFNHCGGMEQSAIDQIGGFKKLIGKQSEAEDKEIEYALVNAGLVAAKGATVLIDASVYTDQSMAMQNLVSCTDAELRVQIEEANVAVEKLMAKLLKKTSEYRNTSAVRDVFDLIGNLNKCLVYEVPADSNFQEFQNARLKNIELLTVNVNVNSGAGARKLAATAERYLEGLKKDLPRNYSGGPAAAA